MALNSFYLPMKERLWKKLDHGEDSKLALDITMWCDLKNKSLRLWEMDFSSSVLILTGADGILVEEVEYL